MAGSTGTYSRSTESLYTKTWGLPILATPAEWVLKRDIFLRVSVDDGVLLNSAKMEKLERLWEGNKGRVVIETSTVEK